jgi:quercetin dioxygenase-like cupin family protein
MSGSDEYFRNDAAKQGRGAEPPTWLDTGTEVSPIELVPGLEFRPVVGAALALNVVSFAPDTEAPLHAHSEEQMTFVLEGEIQFEVDGDVRTMRPGMAVRIPPFAVHGARTGQTPCVEIDVFSPPRRGLLDAIAASGGGDKSEAAKG